MPFPTDVLPLDRSATRTHEAVKSGHAFDPLRAQRVNQPWCVGKRVLDDVINDIPVPLCPVLDSQHLR